MIALGFDIFFQILRRLGTKFIRQQIKLERHRIDTLRVPTDAAIG